MRNHSCKNGARRLVQHRVAANFQSVENIISAKYDEVRYACISAVLFFYYYCWDDSVYSFVFCCMDKHGLFSYWWTWGCFHHLWFRTMFWGTSEVCRVHSGLAVRVEIKASMLQLPGKELISFLRAGSPLASLPWCSISAKGETTEIKSETSKPGQSPLPDDWLPSRPVQIRHSAHSGE